jgi:hypothetical protein
MLGEKAATVHSWKKRDKWGSYGPLDQMQLTTFMISWQYRAAVVSCIWSSGP